MSPATITSGLSSLKIDIANVVPAVDGSKGGYNYDNTGGTDFDRDISITFNLDDGANAPPENSDTSGNLTIILRPAFEQRVSGTDYYCTDDTCGTCFDVGSSTGSSSDLSSSCTDNASNPGYERGGSESCFVGG